jgi:glycosyltransferase involved in cell wall biosynthesis
MCTYNGARFLDEQLQSLAGQVYPVIHLHISDDGSTDDTLDILEHWRGRWTKGEFVVHQGPQKGFAENFRSLILRAPRDHHVAFCDQDDIWHPDKLLVATDQLADFHAQATLYGSRSTLIDSDGTVIGTSRAFRRPPGFGNALVQSLAGGNTMVLNAKAMELLTESARRTSFLMHDWWAYLLISGAGGHIVFDQTPHIDYRQHANNAIGAAPSLLEQPKRWLELWNGKYVRWSDANDRSLERCLDLLNDEACQILARFRTLRQRRFLSAVAELEGSGIYRQTQRGDVAMALAGFFGRL